MRKQTGLDDEDVKKNVAWWRRRGILIESNGIVKISKNAAEHLGMLLDKFGKFV